MQNWGTSFLAEVAVHMCSVGGPGRHLQNEGPGPPFSRNFVAPPVSPQLQQLLCPGEVTASLTQEHFQVKLRHSVSGLGVWGLKDGEVSLSMSLC